MAIEDRKLVMDVVAWFMNVTSSVLIVFVNKKLMDPKHGYQFAFATTLCAFHFLSCAVSICSAQLLGLAQPAKMPLKDTLFFAVVANISIASLNLSLLVNSVGFYQISKLLIIPFVCLVEFFWLKRQFTGPVIASVLTVCIGVAVVTVTDVGVNTTGIVIAATSVVSSGMQQILCGTMQRKFKLSSHQLLSNTAPVQGVMLLFIGPFMDNWISNKWILDYDYHVPALICLTVSCMVAVLVNISQFMCLGRFSAVSFQVLGHAKTILVLLVGWMYFHDTMTGRKLLGMTIAILGMVMYGYATSQASAQAAAKKNPEQVPLLAKDASHDRDLGSRAELGGLGVKLNSKNSL